MITHLFSSLLIFIFYLMLMMTFTLAWKIPWTEEPGGLQSMGSRRVGHDWATSLSLFTFMHWRRKWQPTPVFLPGESQGQGSLMGCCLWGRTELDTTEATCSSSNNMMKLQEQLSLCTEISCKLSINQSINSLLNRDILIYFVTWMLLTGGVSVSIFIKNHRLQVSVCKNPPG